MTEIQKACYKSPLLGAVFLTILSWVYIYIYVLSSQYSLINNIVALFQTTPLLFVFFSFISYIISIPLNLLIYKEMEENLRTLKFFINMSLFSGFIISLIIAIISYLFNQILAKAIFIVIGISLMTTINANYFLVLSGIIKIKERDNENNKGSRV